jgi:aldehyde:ferredoxin oxidoreductase
MKILVVNLQTESTDEELLENPLSGGRLLIAQLANRWINPTVEPLGPDNALILTCSPLAGKNVSTSGRLSIGGKSPLTQGIKESNAGGMAGDSLASLGYRAVVLRGQRPEGNLDFLIIDENGLRFRNAEAYKGLGNESLAAAVRKEYGADYVLIGIGPAGEALMTGAGIAISDAEGNPFRIAARGGMGAVMGSKGLKAVLLRKISTGKNKDEAKESRKARVDFNKHVAANERSRVLREFGTASTLIPLQYLSGLPTRNFSEGEFESAEEIGGDRLHELILERGGVGKTTHACMRGCVIQCSNIFPDAEGELAAAPLEFETLGLCGSNLGLATLDEIAIINRICNDIGVDTIEIGAALGVMMEAAETGSAPAPYDQMNLPRFGDGARAAEIIQEISTGGPLGKLIGQGVVATGAALGVERVPAVKGQAMSAYDPRIIKGTGVTYATSPQGADHTAGLTLFAPIDHRDPDLAVDASRNAQIVRAAYDALGLCVFNLAATVKRSDLVLEMLNTQYGVNLPEDYLTVLGLSVIKEELAFNRGAGMTTKDDRLPAYFLDEQLPPKNDVFNVTDDNLDRIWSDLLDDQL